MDAQGCAFADALNDGDDVLTDFLGFGEMGAGASSLIVPMLPVLRQGNGVAGVAGE